MGNYRIIHYEEYIRAAHHLGYTVKILEIVHNPELIPKFRARCKLNLAEEEWIRLNDKWETDPRVQLLYPAFMKENESPAIHTKDTAAVQAPPGTMPPMSREPDFSGFAKGAAPSKI